MYQFVSRVYLGDAHKTVSVHPSSFLSIALALSTYTAFWNFTWWQRWDHPEEEAEKPPGILACILKAFREEPPEEDTVEESPEKDSERHLEEDVEEPPEEDAEELSKRMPTNLQWFLGTFWILTWWQQ